MLLSSRLGSLPHSSAPRRAFIISFSQGVSQPQSPSIRLLYDHYPAGRGQCMDFVLCLVSASSRRLPNEMIWCANESDGGVAAEGDDCSPLIVRHVTDEEDWWASKHATRDVRPSGQRQRRPPFVPVIGASCSPSG